MGSTTTASERADTNTFEVETQIYTVTPLQEHTEIWTIHDTNVTSVTVDDHPYLPFEVMSEKDLVKLRQSAQRVYDKDQKKQTATKTKQWLWAILVFPFLLLLTYAAYVLLARKANRKKRNSEADTPPSLVSPKVSKTQLGDVVWARRRATMRMQNQECLPDSKFIHRGPLVLTKELKGPVKFVSQEKSASEIQIKFDDNLNEVVNIGTCVEVVPEDSRATTTVSKDKDTHIAVKEDDENGEIRTAETQIRMSGSGESEKPKATPTEGQKLKKPTTGGKKRQQGTRESKQPRIAQENGQRYAATKAETQKLKTAPTEVATSSLRAGKQGEVEEKKGPIHLELDETQNVNTS